MEGRHKSEWDINMRVFFVPFLIPFVAALFFQAFLCLKTKRAFLKALPLIIDLLAFFYAGARFLGIISYASDSTGIYDGGLIAGILMPIMAFGSLIGIAFAWVVYSFIRKAYDSKEL